MKKISLISFILFIATTIVGTISLISMVTAQTCGGYNLVATFSPKSQNGTRFERLTYTVSVTNNNEQACGTGTFYLRTDMYHVSGWTISDFPSSITLSPGQSTSFTLSVLSSSNAELQEYNFILAAALFVQGYEIGTGPSTYYSIGSGFYTVTETKTTSTTTIRATTTIASTTTIPPEESFKIKLYRGWNMISSPVQHRISLTDFENAGCDLLSYKDFKTWRYDPLNDWTHPNYITNDGIYVYSDDECSVEITGTRYTFTSKQLYRGWNMISGDGYLTDILGTCKNHVIKYKGYELLRYNPLKKGWDNPNTLEPTKGYFIKIDQDCTLEFELGGPPLP
jgi:hypothetical protein